MAFDMLTDRFQGLWKRITGQHKLSDQNIRQILQDIRTALLEADVNLEVVENLIHRLEPDLLGTKVQNSLSPSEMVVKLIREELRKILGENQVPLKTSSTGPSVVLLAGLQGSGKTTTAVKLANFYAKKLNMKPLLVAADIYRKAAIDQLNQLGQQYSIPVFSMGNQVNPVIIAQKAIEHSFQNGYDCIIIDTAGRLQIDNQMMDEIVAIKQLVHPVETLLVVDAMAGQQALPVARSFHERLSLTGFILTKLDSDTRGGSTLSLFESLRIPIKMTGTGEKINDFEAFYPERMADRILGMGDIVSVIEKAQENIDEKKAEKTIKRIMGGEFDLEDMLDQMEQMNRMGPLQGIMKLLPGMPKLSDADHARAQDQLKKTKSIILSMTKEERHHPEIMRSSRKERVAKGSGTSLTDVNRVLKQYEQMKESMRNMKSMFGKGGFPNLPF